MPSLYLYKNYQWENITDSFWNPLWNTLPLSSFAQKQLSTVHASQKVKNCLGMMIVGPEVLYFFSEKKKSIYQPPYAQHLSFYEREHCALKNILSALLGMLGSVPLRPIYFVEMIIILIKSILDILLALPIYSLAVRLLVDPKQALPPNVSNYSNTKGCSGTFTRLVHNSCLKLVSLISSSKIDKKSLEECITAEIFVLLSSIDPGRTVQSDMSLEKSPEPILKRVDDLIILAQNHEISIEVPQNLIDRYIASKNSQPIPTTTEEVRAYRDRNPLIHELYTQAGAW